MRKLLYTLIILFSLFGFAFGGEYTIDNTDGETIDGDTICGGACAGGDIIIISKDRTDPIYFQDITGTGITEGTYITIKNDSTGKATITGNTTSWANNIVFIDCQYFKLLGNNYGSETYGIKLTSGNGLRLLRSSDYEIAYIEMSSTYMGIYQNNNITWAEADGPITNVSIHNKYIHDVTGMEAIYLGISSSGDYPKFSGINIYDNIISNIPYDGIQLGQTTGSSNNIYGNTITNTGTGHVSGQWYGIILNPEHSGVNVYQNYIESSYSDGINVHSGGSGADDIHDNIILEAGNHGINIRSDYAHAITNNTVVSSGGYGIQTYAGYTSGTIRYNLVVANSSGNISSDYSTQTDNRTSASEAGEYFSATYRLTYQSPAINAGAGAGYSITDIDGNTRPYGSTAADIGASEFIYKIVNASPPDDSEGTGVDAVLTWHNPDNPTVDVYFEKVVGACDLQVGDLVVDDGANTETYDPGTMDESSEYCWRADLDGETGDVYSFTTTNLIPPTTGLAPIEIDSGGAPIIINSGGTPIVIGE